MLKDIWQKTTLNGRTYTCLPKFRKESQLPAEQVREMIRLQNLRATLWKAYQNHPFHRERFDASGFDPFRMGDADPSGKIRMLISKISAQ